MRLFGIETEYGITREDQDTVDPVVESMELVRAHLTASFERGGTMAAKIRTRMREGFGSPACSRIKRKTSSPRSMPIGRSRFMR
jgi:hypothetical protein